jgi:hypothetical protein
MHDEIDHRGTDLSRCTGYYDDKTNPHLIELAGVLYIEIP